MDSIQARRQLNTKINQAKKILLLTDERKDGDTLGSSLALYHYLRSLGKTAKVFSLEPLPSDLMFLPGASAITRDPQIFQEPWEIVIALDSSRDVYIKHLTSWLKEPAELLVIDHHASNPLYGDLNLVEPSFSSTAEQLYCFFETNRLAITAEIATCLLTGILSDTGYFAHASSSKVLMAAAGLLKAGASYPKIARFLSRSKSFEFLALWGRALERLVLSSEWGMATTFILPEDTKGLDLNDESMEGLYGLLKSLKVPSFVILRDLGNGQIKGSCRTEDDLLNFAKFFGGGGHVKACGFTIRGRLEKVEENWQIIPFRR
ncbi:MAG: DHH family phosphoesterase [bacterium]